MAAERPPGLSSQFDDMLKESRKQFEELAGVEAASTKASRNRPARTPSASPSAAPRSQRPVTTSAGPPGAAVDEPSSDPVRFLNDRYGAGWRYEIVDRRTEADEVVVECKLIIEDRGISTSQSGRARVVRSGEAREITGSADGVAFTVRPDDAPPGGTTGDPVEAAFQRAVKDALTKCAAMI